MNQTVCRKKLIVVDIFGRERTYLLRLGHVLTADRLFQMRQPNKETILPFDDGSIEGGLAHFKGKNIESIEMVADGIDFIDGDDLSPFGTYGEDEV